MVIFKKILLTLSAVVAINSDAMWIGKPLLKAFAKRSIVSRVTAIKPNVRQFDCKTTVAAYAKSRQAGIVFRSKTPSSFASRAKPKYKRISFGLPSIKYLAGASAALGVSYASASCEGDKESGKKPVAQYQAPFETSRKKFYGDLESKPWGEVSKKYIKALQEEEQKLMDEFFEITKLSQDEWNKTLTEKQQAINLTVNDDAKKMENANNPISPSFKLGLEAAANACGLDHRELRYGYSEDVSDVMGVYGNLVYISKNFDFGDEIDYETQATMRHEMQHILHSDSCVRESIGTYCKKDDAFYCRWSRFKEKRADILALLSIHPDFHPALNNYAYVLLMQLPESASMDTHPSWGERARYSRQLHKEMKEAIGKE